MKLPYCRGQRYGASGNAFEHLAAAPPASPLGPPQEAWLSWRVAEILLTLISRRDCPLCDEMKAVIEAVMGGESARLEVRDVDEDAELVGLYGTEVPVLLVNGRKAFKYRVTAAQLRRRMGTESGRSRWWRRPPANSR